MVQIDQLQMRCIQQSLIYSKVIDWTRTDSPLILQLDLLIFS
jgi:hypothetical protein